MIHVGTLKQNLDAPASLKYTIVLPHCLHIDTYNYMTYISVLAMLRATTSVYP